MRIEENEYNKNLTIELKKKEAEELAFLLDLCNGRKIKPRNILDRLTDALCILYDK